MSLRPVHPVDTGPALPPGLPPDVALVVQSLLRAKDEERACLEREVHELRRQLRAIHTSSGWAILRTLTQIRERLAPRGGKRDQLARSSLNSLRRLKRAYNSLLADHRARRAVRSHAPRPLDPGAYTVICLPIIEWAFRFQRPQQLMRQFARHGHNVLYAANHFHNGHDARLRPVEPNVHELLLPGDLTANVYHTMPAPADVERMAAAIAGLRDAMSIRHAVVVVQLPYWSDLAESLRHQFGWPIIYDCMDDHSGFFNNTETVLEGEARLVASADLVVTSSDRLERNVVASARRSLLLRNACEYAPFSAVKTLRPARGRRPLVGYYGAIAEWFDGDLVAELARLRPAWRFELIGSTLAGDVSSLLARPNVRLLGERPYDELPRWIENWDAFLIPFKRVPLTEATNPVKVYEMLATGRPVVAVGLPELLPIASAGLISIAHDAAGFARALDRHLDEDVPALREARQAFARQNTWDARHATLAEAIASLRSNLRRDPPASPHSPHSARVRSPLRYHDI